jgi:Tol biopolymer transport system component
MRNALAAILAAVLVAGPGFAQQATDSNDIWLLARAGESLRRLTEATAAGRESGAGSISADGGRIAFVSDDDFLGEGIANGTDEIWLYEVATATLTRVTVASDPARDSSDPSISADGARIAFASDSDFHGEGIPSGQTEIWFYDVATRQLTRLTRALAPGGESAQPDISADGTTVAFASNAVLEGEAAGTLAVDIWLVDVSTGALRRVTRGGPRTASANPDLNANATRVAFESNADLSGGGPRTASRDLWLYDLAADVLTRITEGGDPSRASEAASISADGRRVAFYSDADLLGEGRPDSVDEVWLYDAPTASLRRITSLWVPERDAGTNPVLHPDAANVEITADGNAIVFASDGDLLDEGLPSGYPHVWIHDLRDDDLRRIDTSAGSGSGLAITPDASRIALFRSAFDEIRRMRATASAGPARPETMTPEMIAADLDALQRELEERWAYVKANGVDLVAAIGGIRGRGAAGMAFDEYGIEVQKLIAGFIDGHAGVGGFGYPRGFLPFFIEKSGDRFVAVRPDRSGFLADGFPYVRSLDGAAIADWIEAAAPFNPQGSPQYVTWRGLRQIALLQFMRSVMGLPQSETVRVELAAADGARTTEIELPVAAAASSGSTWPRARSGLIDGDVGYIRIESMTPDAAVDIDVWMNLFRDTRGLIVDVRGNGGGLRHPLRALYPYLVSDEAPPRVINAAKYRLHPDNAEDHLGGSRFLYRESWESWTPAEREAIRRFKETFRPEWTPPEAEFSEWHYLVLARHNNPNAYVYGKPVIVLIDEKCFSATDIFLSGLKGVPGVTLVGYPSGGGSARAVGARLPESGLSLRLASMASFQHTGLLYDGNGIEPDVIVDPAPDFFLDGGEDNVLEAAISMLDG